MFCLYTNDYQISSDQCNITKYADDTVLTGLLYDDDSSAIVNEVQRFVDWCKSNSLLLNVIKTEELVFDFRKGKRVHDHIIIDGKAVKRVASYKYLGTHIDNKLNWYAQAKAVRGKGRQRLYFLRKLKQCRVDETIMKLFYQSIIQSVLTFSIICFFGSMPKKHRAELERVRKAAERIIGSSLPTLSSIYEGNLLNKINKIKKDNSHPFNKLTVFNRSGIRLHVPITRTSRFRNSFIPEAIHLYNSRVIRSDHNPF